MPKLSRERGSVLPVTAAISRDGNGKLTYREVLYLSTAKSAMCRNSSTFAAVAAISSSKRAGLSGKDIASTDGYGVLDYDTTFSVGAKANRHAGIRAWCTSRRRPLRLERIEERL